MKTRLLVIVFGALVAGSIPWWRGTPRPQESTRSSTEVSHVGENATTPRNDALVASQPVQEPKPATTETRLAGNNESKALQEPTTIEKCRNRGSATPEDAFETMCWAALAGNDDVLAGSFYVKDKYEAKLAEAWDKLSAETKAKYKSPEHVLSLFFSKELLAHCVALQCTTSLQQDGQEAVLTVDVQTAQGHKQRKMPMVKVEGIWKFPILSSQVDRLAGMLAQLK